MMAPKLLQLDTEALELVVNKSMPERESSLSLLTLPQREFDSASVWQGSTVSEKDREIGPIQITALDLQKKPKSAQLQALNTAFALTAVDLDSFSVVFRNMSIIFSAFALVLVEWKRYKGVSRSEPLSTHTPSVRDHPESLLTAGILPGLHKHWMSALQQRIYISLVFFAVGFSAITALAIAVIGWLPLDIATYVLVWPSLIIWLVLGILYPDYGKLALKGFVIGILACLFYDCMRFVTIELGLWGDFIPGISMLLFHTDKPNWVIGYIWRYVGDGGLMSVAFVVGYRLLKPKLDVRVVALSFGMAIWGCLVATILLAPQGAETLFPLTPVTLSLSLLGHVIYGLSIGFLYPVFVRDSVSILQVSASPSELPAVESQPQTPEKEAIAPPSQPILITGSSRRPLTCQFVKPGFIDARYSTRAENFGAPA